MTSSNLQKMKKKMETLIQTIGIYSQEIGKEFGIEKCAMLIIKNGKREATEGMSKKNQIAWRKRKLQILGNIGNRYHQTSRDERKNLKKEAQKNKKTSGNQTLLQKFHQRVLRQISYSDAFLKWMREELCKKLNFDQTIESYMHKPESTLENGLHKILWDFEMQTDHLFQLRRPDLELINKKKENLLVGKFSRSKIIIIIILNEFSGILRNKQIT